VKKGARKLLRLLKINGREGRGFSTLRHTFRTVADEVKDQPAIDFILGHESPHMSSVYRETISDERLKAVTDRSIVEGCVPASGRARFLFREVARNQTGRR